MDSQTLLAYRLSWKREQQATFREDGKRPPFDVIQSCLGCGRRDVMGPLSALTSRQCAGLNTSPSEHMAVTWLCPRCCFFSPRCCPWAWHARIGSYQVRVPLLLLLQFLGDRRHSRRSFGSAEENLFLKSKGVQRVRFLNTIICKQQSSWYIIYNISNRNLRRLSVGNIGIQKWK